MSVLHIVTFNENDTSDVRDYSTREGHSVSATVTIEDGVYGKRGVFDGSTTGITFDDYSYMDSMAEFFFHWEGIIGSSANNEMLFGKHQVFVCRKNTNDTVSFLIRDSASNNYIATTGSAVPLDTHVKIQGYYDGTNTRLFIDGVLDGEDTTGVGNPTNQNTEVYSIGYRDVGAVPDQRFGGKIEFVALYDERLTDGERNELLENPQGIYLRLGGEALATDWEVGDLIYNDTTTNGEVKCVIIFKDDHEYRVWPVGGSIIPREGMEMWRIGHAWDEERAFSALIRGVGLKQEIRFMHQVHSFEDLDDDDNERLVLSEIGSTEAVSAWYEVEEGKTRYIYELKQMTVHDELFIDGTLIVDGELIIET
jgi:hypothetical protein